MFEKIISLENLFAAWTEFKKEKANRKDVAEFELNLENHIFTLHECLKNGAYKHGGYQSFFVCDPKRRHIHKASVGDRLLHHAVFRVIEPIWNKAFIFDSWSSRKGKGSHGAVRRLQKLALKLSKNGTHTLWVLKLDVKKFFASVDQGILLHIIKKRIFDERLMGLLAEIIKSFSSGLPLGNLTSQLFANIYLDHLDQFIKHKLKIVGYIRYADDFILMHCDKKTLLSYFTIVNIFLQERLKLEIHPQKIVFKTYTSGIDYLGYVCFLGYRVLRTKTMRRMFKRVNKNNLASYWGILKHCRSQKLRAKLAVRYIS
ncbi:MAG: reverse transcriptase/maturase family protein [bacterium]